MRFILSTALILSATSAIAQDTADASAPLAGIAISTSYNISAPMAAKTPAESTAEERTYRQNMYAQSAKECADVMETIGKTCTVTSVQVSTQVTRQPGLLDQMYATGSVTMQVELK